MYEPQPNRQCTDVLFPSLATPQHHRRLPGVRAPVIELTPGCNLLFSYARAGGHESVRAGARSRVS